MWSEMSENCREEYRDYFIAYHNGVAKTGITGKRIKPVTVLPRNVIKGFEKALLVKVRLFVCVKVFICNHILNLFTNCLTNGLKCHLLWCLMFDI